MRFAVAQVSSWWGSTFNNVVWIFVGALLTLLIEWLVRGGIAKIRGRLSQWWDGPAQGPFDDPLILVRPRDGDSDYQLINAGQRTYHEFRLSRASDDSDHSDFVGFSPYGNGVSTIMVIDTFRVNATIRIPQSWPTAEAAPLRWSARYDADTRLRRLADKIKGRRRDTFGTVDSSRAVDADKPLQHQLVRDVRSLFGLAAGYPKEPAPEVEAAVMAISDEHARQILRNSRQRTYENPVPGVTLH